MKGSIKKRGKDSWTIIYDAPRGTDGKRKQKYVTIQGTKRDAERAQSRLLSDVGSGLYVDPCKLTVAQYLAKWLGEHSPNVSAKTLERYREVIEKHLVPAIGSIPLDKLKPQHIQDYYSNAAMNGRRDGKGGLAPRTIQYHHHVIHRALGDAVKRWNLLRNPAAACDVPKAERHKVEVLSAQETLQLLMVARGTDWYIPVLLAATTGMRRGEILALDWGSVDLESGTLAVRRTLQQTREGLTFKEPKTRSAVRVIALLPMTVEALRKHKRAQEESKAYLKGIYDDQGLVCSHQDGTPYHPDSVSHNFHRLVTRAGLDRRRFHDLRHTHATLLLEQGVHPKVVQERLGHASIVVTQDIYSHIMPTIQKDAAARLQEVLGEKVCEQYVSIGVKEPPQ